MKKIGKKGFLMAEAIVVGLFIMTLFTFIFANTVPLLAKYEAQEKYESVNSVFDANLVRNAILLDIKRSPGNNTLTKIFGGLSTRKYILYDGNAICNNLALVTYCKTLFSKTFLDIDSVIASKYRTADIKSVKGDFPRAIGDYIDSMPEYTSSVGSIYDSYYRLIIVFNDGRMTSVEIKI